MSEEHTTGGSAAPDGEELTAADVRHVADLARVEVAADESERFATQFAEILAYFETLDEVPETDADPELTNVLRADEVHEGLTQEEALRNAPETEEGYFKGPRVS